MTGVQTCALPILVASISEGLRLDDIIKSTGSQIRTVYFNEKGDLVAAAENK